LGGIEQDEGGRIPLGEAAWMSLMHALDSGAVGGDTGWTFRLVMFGVTLAGLFIVGSLIGVLTSSIESQMDQLRKGRSFVIEENHTLILGWSPSVFSIISELAIANSNQRKPRIVVLADEDKVEMEDEIRAKCGELGRTQVICRTGSPIDLHDLEIANPHAAKSIIILSPDENDPDAQVIKTILAITNNPNRRPTPYHVVSEIRDRKNLEVAHMVGGEEVQLVLVDDLISRITVQACRQSGISVVYIELLDFDGDEIYFHEEPALVGQTFGAALTAFENSSLIGLQFRDGRVQVNPPSDTLIAAGDKVIAIAEDDDKVLLSHRTNLEIDTSAIVQTPPPIPAPERTLILGWNRRGYSIISELDAYVAPGSEVTVVALPEAGEEIENVGALQLANQRVIAQQGDTSDRSTLDALDIPSYPHVIVLGYNELMGVQEADAKTLITLLHLRDIGQKNPTRTFSIVSEMLDVGNRELAAVTQADDFIVSDKLISLMLAQVSENKYLNAVLEDIFDSSGSEMYLKPAPEYVATDRAVNFYTVVEAARRRGEVAIGYKQQVYASDASKAYGVVVNPCKSDKVTFATEDRIIVLTES